MSNFSVEELVGGWLNIYLCNHDQARIVTRWGDEGEYLATCAKMFGMFYSFKRGTPFIFQGEELGMTSWKFTKEEADDVEFKNAYKDLVEEKKVLTHDEFMATCHKIGRDCARSPVHWDDSPNAGFTTGKPWLPVISNYATINAKTEAHDPNSVLNFYKKMVATRKAHPALIFGDFKLLDEFANPLFVYRRQDGDVEFISLSNFSTQTLSADLSSILAGKTAEVVLSNYEGVAIAADHKLEVKPYLGLLIKVTKNA